jgi:TPR repeat protein
MGSSKHAQAVVDRWLALARKGDAEAYFQLGLIYAEGEGETPDLIQAHKWFNLAAAAGDQRGIDERAEIAAQLTSMEVAQAQRAARAWIEHRV